jgi:hypothetical protein
MVGFAIMREQCRKAALCAILAALMLGFPTHAMQSRTPVNVASLGPQVGESVPDFTLPDQSGQERTLQSILGPKGAVLLFHRSADW